MQMTSQAAEDQRMWKSWSLGTCLAIFLWSTWNAPWAESGLEYVRVVQRRMDRKLFTWYDNHCALQICVRCYFEDMLFLNISCVCVCVPSDVAMFRNTITFNSMIDAFDKGGEWKRAVWLLEQDLRGNLSDKSGRLVDVIGFNAAISACEEAAKWEEALELLKQLQGALQADVTLVLRVLSKSRFFGGVFFSIVKGLVWVMKMRVLGWAIVVKIAGAWFQTRISFNAAISCCETSTRWREALMVFLDTQLNAVHPNVRCLVDMTAWHKLITAFHRSETSSVVFSDLWIMRRSPFHSMS